MINSKCDYCIGKEFCVNKYTLSAWCKDMSEFRIFMKTYKESKEILQKVDLRKIKK